MAKEIKYPICGNNYEDETPAPRAKKPGKLKWIMLALVVALLLPTVGCSSGSGSSDEGNASTEASAETTAADEAAASDETEAATEEASTEAVTTAETEAASFEEITLLESDDYVVKITDISDGLLTDYIWKLYVENNTDKNVTFSLSDVYVDGAANDPFWALDVAAGKNGYSDVEWYTFSNYGITDPTIIEGSLHVYDTDTWDDYYAEPFTVTPLGEDKVQMVTRTPQDTDKILLDDKYVTVTETSYTSSSDTIEIALYIEAKTDAPVTVSIDDCAINDTMCDPFWACSVAGNKVACTTVTWYDTTLEESNLTIDDVKDITFTMNVYDTDTYDDYDSESISVTAE